jgi:hypothetical protein
LSGKQVVGVWKKFSSSTCRMTSASLTCLNNIFPCVPSWRSKPSYPKTRNAFRNTLERLVSLRKKWELNCAYHARDCGFMHLVRQDASAAVGPGLALISAMMATPCHVAWYQRQTGRTLATYHE